MVTALVWVPDQEVTIKSTTSLMKIAKLTVTLLDTVLDAGVMIPK